MPLVFVHGVANRMGDDYEAGVANRDALFGRFLLSSHRRPDDERVSIFNPYWGDHGGRLHWGGASLPLEDFEVLGTPDDATMLGLYTTASPGGKVEADRAILDVAHDPRGGSSGRLLPLEGAGAGHRRCLGEKLCAMVSVASRRPVHPCGATAAPPWCPGARSCTSSPAHRLIRLTTALLRRPAVALPGAGDVPRGRSRERRDRQRPATRARVRSCQRFQFSRDHVLGAQPEPPRHHARRRRIAR